MPGPPYPPKRLTFGTIMAALLLLTFLPPASGDEESVVERTLPPIAQCAHSVDVHLHLDWGGDRSEPALMVHETPPTGWRIEQASHGGSLATAGEIRWFLTDPTIDRLSYRLSVPAGAEEAVPFSGVHRDESTEGPDRPTEGDSLLTVDCPQARVDRHLPPHGGCGETITTTLTLDPDGSQHLILQERPPAGWEVLQADTGGTVSPNGQVKWFLTDPQSGNISYQARVPQHAQGPHSFTGSYRDDRLPPEEPSHAVAGAHEIVIACPDGPPDGAAQARREAPLAVHPQALPFHNNSFTVTITLDWGNASALALNETIPPHGLVVTGASHNAQLTGDRIRWQLDDPAVIRVHYELHVVDTAVLAVFGQRTINGTLVDSVREALGAPPSPLGGSSTLLVTHRFDGTQDCRFDDNELFTVIDAWKHEQASDNELFSGIDAWKQLPGTYCQ